MNSNTARYGLLPLLARLFLVSEFLIAVNGKLFGWSGEAAYMAAHGMHFVQPLLGAALVIELVGSICLITEVQARLAAGIMCAYLGNIALFSGITSTTRSVIAAFVYKATKTTPARSVAMTLRGYPPEMP
jgi:uncharacterized membrane protein YphA (DoxX/SURF4 family)